MLDVSIRLEMLSLLDDLRLRFRLALLYITHDIASARYFADEILVMYAGRIVERGPAEQLTQHPAHPYTQLLVASAPDPDNLGNAEWGRARSAGAGKAEWGRARSAGAGKAERGGNGAGRRRPESTGPAATGCPFSPRCPFADDRCRAEDPALRRVSDVRAAACWHLDVAAPGVLAEPQGGGT